MIRMWPVGLVAVGAGAALSVALASTNAPATPEPFFDPVLSAPGAICTSNSPRRLMDTYLRLAQGETKPIPPQAAGGAAPDLSDAPLFRNLGKLTWKITTASPSAQQYFDQGLKLAYGFNHAEARRAFRTAQRKDPACAMCYWGEALVLGPNINAPMDLAAVAPAMAALRKAQELAPQSSAREQALIAALAKRYADDQKADRSALDLAYADAMRGVAESFGDDDNVLALYAEALLDLTPWDYWEDNGRKPKGRTPDIITTLEKVIARDPNHIGAVHYYIHTMESSATPERALPYLPRLAAAAPGLGHLVHMPFHIYNRIGDYRRAIWANQAAVTADEIYIARAKPTGIYPAAYYPHNIHSLLASAQMTGAGGIATAAAEKLARVVTSEASREIPWVQPIQVAPYFAHAQFSRPRTILALENPGDDLPFVKAMWHYARGVAHAANRNVAAARAEEEAIVKLKDNNFGDLSLAVPVMPMLDLAAKVVEGRIALAENNLPAAQAAFEQAAKIQDELPYGEPPHWYYPVRQSLGAVFLRLGRVDDAEQAFKAALVIAPNNGWALYGLTQVYRRNGQRDALAAVKARLDRVWTGDRRRLDLARL